MKQYWQNGLELMGFFVNKRWWLIPPLLVLFLIAALLIFGQTSVIAPLVYPLF